jgi:hypothetical protein
MVKPAVIAGGAFVLILIVVVVLGFMSKPKFWGLFSKEFDDCTSNTVYISNASTYQLDEDKKCVLVKTCVSGYEPNSSNNACETIDTDTLPPAASETVDTDTLPPAASETIDAKLDDVTNGPESTDLWENHTDENNVKNALQYAKIGDKWQVSMCQLQYYPMTNKDSNTKDLKPKVCIGQLSNPDGYCSSTDIYADKSGIIAPGVCGAYECLSGYVPYNGKCVEEATSISSKWKDSPGAAAFSNELLGQPGYVELPKDELHYDRSCGAMCKNIGTSKKSNKPFRSFLPSNWKGSVVSSTQPSARFFNHSINDMAWNEKLWDENTAKAYITWFFKGIDDAGSRGGHKKDVYDPTGVNALEEARLMYRCSTHKQACGDDFPKLTQVELDDWRNTLFNGTPDLQIPGAICACTATEEPGYLFT